MIQKVELLFVRFALNSAEVQLGETGLFFKKKITVSVCSIMTLRLLSSKKCLQPLMKVLYARPL